MAKYSCTDLKVVLILTFLSVVFLLIPSLNQYPQNIICYAILLLFLPGYSLLAAIKPSVNEISTWKRVLFSVGLGAIMVAVVYSLGTYTPVMSYLAPLVNYLSPLNIYLSPIEAYVAPIFILSVILIIDLVVVAWIRRGEKAHDSVLATQDKKERYLYCKKCKGYYELEKGESPEDFGSCQCGGELVYAEKLRDGEEEAIKPVTLKRFKYLDLLMVLVVNIFCILVLQLANQPNYNTVVEFLLILFLPGYALISTVYPRKDDVAPLERLTYGVASSIAITTVVAIALIFTSYKQMSPILYVLCGLTLVFILAAYIRRSGVKEENRFSINFDGFKGLNKGFSRENRTEKLLSLMLVISVVLVVCTTFITANPLEGKPYTDFYVLGADGNTVNSINLTSGDNDNLTISIVNHENKKTTYRLLVTSGGVVQTDQTVTLENKQKTDINLNFTVGDPGSREMEFSLYKLPDNSNVYKSLKIPLIVNEITAGSEEIIEE